MPAPIPFEEYKRRAGIITPMLKAKARQIDMARACGITHASLAQFINRYRINGKWVYKPGKGGRPTEKEQPWQKGDPSTLSAKDLETCARLDIKPARMAWLLSCPKGTGKFGLAYGGSWT